MSSDPSTPPPRPSVFISYASEDRAPTRLLREALAAAGLEVWYDENELGGGDAWDQKIRRQIRECTYFMPVISATTERRREGYFRREWRLATERSLDMADDVMFLVPVVIDDTDDQGARVPEKFLTVQWLRLPGGQPTPALTALAQRLLAHDQAEPPAPRPAPPPPPKVSGSRPPQLPPAAEPSAAAKDGPPPMPPFPQRPLDRHHRPRYIAEVLWWLVTACWMILLRTPKIFRIVLSIWVALAIASWFRRNPDPAPPPAPAPAHVEKKDKDDDKPAKPDLDEEKVDAALEKAADSLDQTAADKNSGQVGAGFAHVGAEFARALSDEIRPVHRVGREALGIVPFDLGVADPAEKKIAGQIFEAAFGQLSVARPGRIRPLGDDETALDTLALASQARKSREEFFAIAKADTVEGERVLRVIVYSVKNSAPVWSGQCPFSPDEVGNSAAKISQAILNLLPKPPPKVEKR